jgi:hypothetical protein
LAAWNTGAIADSYNTGNTNGLNGSAGGVVGVNEGPGSITRSYSAGSVTGTSNTGGLVGWFLGGAVTNSYWDTATSGQSASPGGGTGLTTAQMKTAATFTAAGWDPTVWNMVDGAYPTLKASRAALTEPAGRVAPAEIGASPATGLARTSRHPATACSSTRRA